MTDLAERTTGLDVLEETKPSWTPGHAPPGRVPPSTPYVTPPWPPRAKAVVAILLIAAVLGAIGTVIGFTSGDDATTTEQEYQSTIEALTAERSELVSQATELQATIDTLTDERDVAVAQLADVQWTIAALTAERDDAVAEVTQTEATLATLTAERDDLVDQVGELESDLAAQIQLTATAISERDALADLFPIELDVSIQNVDLVGTYDVKLAKAYCEGFADCATLPSVDEFTIRKTPEGYLQLVIDDYVTAPMFRVDGALYAIADSTTAVASCAGTARVARIAVTLYGHGLTIADDGTPQVTDLGASLSVQAPATASCPAGLAFYGAQITPQA